MKRSNQENSLLAIARITGPIPSIVNCSFRATVKRLSAKLQTANSQISKCISYHSLEFMHKIIEINYKQRMMFLPYVK